MPGKIVRCIAEREREREKDRMTTETTIVITIRRALSLTALIKPSFSNNPTNLTAWFGLAWFGSRFSFTRDYSMFEYAMPGKFQIPNIFTHL